MASAFYPVTFKDGTSPILDSHDLIRYVQEKCGFEVAAIVKNYVSGIDVDDLDDLCSLSRDFSAVQNGLEDVIEEFKVVIANIKTRLRN